VEHVLEKVVVTLARGGHVLLFASAIRCGSKAVKR